MSGPWPIGLLSVFWSLSLTHSSLFGICSIGSNRTVCIICSFCTVHVRLGPIVHSVTGHPENVVPDAGQELPDCPASSDAILAEREEVSLQTDVLASDSLPRWLTNKFLAISDTTFRFSIWMASTSVQIDGGL